MTPLDYSTKEPEPWTVHDELPRGGSLWLVVIPLSTFVALSAALYGAYLVLAWLFG